MYLPGQVARAIDVSNTSVRNWSKDFEEFLSPSANPAPGVPRQYTEDDLLVLSTVAVLRSQMVTTEDIRQALADGTRLEPLHRPKEEQAAESEEAAENQPRIMAAVNALEAALTTQQARIAALEVKNDALNERLIAAEAARAAAETELRVLRELYQDSQAAQPSGRKMSFREWLQSRRQ